MIDNLSKHPEAHDSKHKNALAQASKEVRDNLEKLERLKPRLNKRHERFEQLMKDRDARRGSATLEQPVAKSQDFQGRSRHKRDISDSAIDNETETLGAEENKDLAVKLARSEFRRRAIERKATRQAGISAEVENERRTAGLWGNWEEAFTQNDGELDQDTLSKQMQDVRAQVNGTSRREDHIANQQRVSESYRPSFRYPPVPHQGRLPARRIPSFTPDSPPNQSSEFSQAPELPPKDEITREAHDELPARPAKEALTRNDASRSTPVPSSDLKPSALTFKPSAYLENGTPLRTIFLPPDLRHRFLSIAQPNTNANLETCGILCGSLISNALFISKLIIPEQISTSDTCETVNESEFFDYVDGEDLLVLGWIHTHPTQTCFMSSRDLHTHGGYQVMMPESIAIVCAPSKGEWGVFRLTDPPGMKAVLNCTQTGLFHPHAESNIYTDALRPGHVKEAKGLEFEVVDMRPARS